ncbi:methyl-accepting chemotaxis protein [Brevundimonas lenta]|uniref:Methyl-accepting chemotaxis protein n=1 Tax=Brevundimonas lenta TaxID=424796 RepID=A0A7W6JEW4_9CAUL|nr:methyl-accepting chemotaxis protein [Brevundimonas lenta]MBB4083857.1 methyl-accepting chemotaxis protein [Brevundimonas lenta]
MFKTIRAKVAVAGVAVLVLCGASAGAGMWMTSSLSQALEGSSRSSEVLRNHMQADMMHDALRSDVLSAILAADPSAGIDLADVRAETAEHVASFREAMTTNKALATDPDIRKSLGEVEAPLQAYIAAAERIVAQADANPAAARAGLAPFKQAFLDLEGRMETTAGDIETVAEAARVGAEAKAALGHNVMLGAVIAGILFSLALFAAATRMIVRPIRSLADEMRALASGRTDVDLTSARRGDEIGAVGRAVGDLQDLIVQRISEETAEADRRRAADDDQRRQAEQARAVLAREQGLVVDALGTGLSQLSRGDLTHRINEAFPAEYEKLKEDFNAAMVQLEQAMSQVVSNVSAIRSGSGEISHAADDLSRRTEQQAASLEETAAALDEITATVNKTASGARQASTVVQAARGDAEVSGAVVRDAVAAMSAIEQSAQQISQIIGVIDEIAFQTNLLALNAGVEAARAGDAGRGFAVVASEVRALAQRSAEAAKEIKTLISASTTQVGAGVDLVGQTGEALQRIVSRVAEIDSLVSEIAASAQEQATGLQQVNTAVNQMDQVTQQNAAMVEESTAASHSLTQEAEGLASSVARFRTASTDAHATNAPAHRPVPQMRAVGRGGAALKPAPISDEWAEF